MTLLQSNLTDSSALNVPESWLTLSFLWATAVTLLVIGLKELVLASVSKAIGLVLAGVRAPWILKGCWCNYA